MNWKIILAIGGALLVALIIGPIAWQAGGAIGAAVASYSGLLAALLIALALLAAVGGLRILFAHGRLAAAKARQAEVMTAHGNLIHVDDVTRIAAPHYAHALDRHYDVEAIRAAVPQATHWHQEIHHASPQLPPPDELLSISGPPQLQLPQLGSGSGPQLAHLRQIGHVCRSGNSLLVGYGAGVPHYIELPEAGFIGIGGQPRVGKSVTATLLIAQAVLSGWHVFIGDPHIHKQDGLLNRLRPLSGRLARQAVTPDEIAAMIRLVDKIGRRRAQGDGDRTPVIMVIDEFSNLVWRELLPPDVLAILPSMAAEHAGVGVHGALIAHDWSKASLGGELGAALRRMFTHRIVHRMDPGNVEFLLPKGSAAQARAVQGLDKGQALYFGPDGAVTVGVPLVGDEDAEYAAQDTPERPYTPRKQLSATTARPAPQQPPAAPAAAQRPTVELPPPTIPDQILLLLDARPWLTSTEIADALHIDVQVARVELSELSRRRALTQRLAPKAKRDKYEWSLAQPLNDLMADRLALSA